MALSLVQLVILERMTLPLYVSCASVNNISLNCVATQNWHVSTNLMLTCSSESSDFCVSVECWQAEQCSYLKKVFAVLTFSI